MSRSNVVSGGAIVNPRYLTLLLLTALLQGCNACWITQPTDPIGLVTQ